MTITIPTLGEPNTSSIVKYNQIIFPFDHPHLRSILFPEISDGIQCTHIKTNNLGQKENKGHCSDLLRPFVEPAFAY